MRIAKDIISLISALLLFSPARAQQPIADLVVSNYDYSNAPWTGGRLSLPVDGRSTQIEFEMVRRKLSSFTILSGKRKLSLIIYVKELGETFPNRMQFGLYQTPNSASAELVISMPYKNADGNCVSRDISLRRLRVTKVSDVATANVRCVY